MERINERCFTWPPVDAGVKVVPAGETVSTSEYDVRGMKILCLWIKTDQELTVTFEYLCEDKKEILQVTDPAVIKPVQYYSRFQFGTYASTQLPGYFMRVKLENGGAIPASVVIRGLGQLQ